jgi:type II secretory pathway pseudopilin PulG
MDDELIVALIVFASLAALALVVFVIANPLAAVAKDSDKSNGDSGSDKESA